MTSWQGYNIVEQIGFEQWIRWQSVCSSSQLNLELCWVHMPLIMSFTLLILDGIPNVLSLLHLCLPIPIRCCSISEYSHCLSR